jgi:Tfp pilus assembly protein PilZ
MEASKEKRRFVRADFRVPVRFRENDYEVFSSSLACDISQGGIRIRCHKLIPVGQNLKLAVQPNSLEPVIEVEARVVWIKEEIPEERFQLGLIFEDTPSEVRAQIYRSVIAKS